MKLKIILFVFLAFNLFKVFSQNNQTHIDSVRFKDYKEFMFYVRDSMALEYIASQIMMYSTSIFEDDRPYQLNWRAPINLKYEEDRWILWEFKLIDSKETDFNIITENLNYRKNRADSDSTLIFPDLTGVSQANINNSEFTFKNKWGKELNNYYLKSLTPEQIDAYLHWFERDKKSNLRGCCFGYKLYIE